MVRPTKTISTLAHIRDILVLPFTVTVILPYFIYRPYPIYLSNDLPIRVVGVLLSIFGIALLYRTVSLFRKQGEGTIAPWEPTQRLIVVGPYRYCRNPMITGVLFILLGETFFLLSPHLLALAVIFFLTNTIYFIYREEPGLVLRFGQEYTHYKENVPRWIPNWKPYPGFSK
ncbi:isoprenylcysteine carboxylmethyltransferase family protein [Leptospira langatensis]|uniref:Isoprenylcysteine carboxylmethyltransferase family protein n=1 Tax=Leptospira langatensis TaxID=2484983 RepID=A0A5F1ZXP8_9LEPT|nr:isoprenylcysteine carboxylmethyltransferase family protein [Leptospira langatensis]TGK01192.1 isoprenylcysteine carboxylmethyltransferase family protein [Leptospira langatensis]TGL42357.1 isoprenylcysteine carboxylmethyltransferase family protein [Leptospira langatensis]